MQIFYCWMPDKVEAKTMETIERLEKQLSKEDWDALRDAINDIVTGTLKEGQESVETWTKWLKVKFEELKKLVWGS